MVNTSWIIALENNQNVRQWTNCCSNESRRIPIHSLVLLINAGFRGLYQKHKLAGAGGLRLVVLGVGRVVGWRCMPECVTEPEK